MGADRTFYQKIIFFGKYFDVYTQMNSKVGNLGIASAQYLKKRSSAEGAQLEQVELSLAASKIGIDVSQKPTFEFICVYCYVQRGSYYA